MKIGLFLFLVFLLLAGCQDKTNVEYNSVDIEKLKNEIISVDDLGVNKKWNELNDSLKLKLTSDLSKYYRKAEDSANFYLWNTRFFKVSSASENSINIADSFWDRASFNLSKNNLDSAYFYYQKALRIYSDLGLKSRVATMLYNSAKVQLELKNFTGADVITIESLKLYEYLDDFSGIYRCYNLLGIIHNNLNNYNTALGFHTKALDIANQLSNDYFIISSINNISVLYQEHGYYQDAISFSQNALQSDSLFFKYPTVYAKLIDNLAYSRLKSGLTNSAVLEMMNLSRKIRDSLSDEGGLSLNDIHIAEYYISVNNISRAKHILVDLVDFTKKNENAADLMTALELLGKVDSANSQKYLEERIAISDSLIDIERKTQNKFARTQYETDKVIANNEQLASEKKLIIISGAIGLLLVSLIYFLNTQRIRVKKLRLERAQVKSNEEIYQLLISQQNHLEEGRRLEKNRMSKELHDSVLGKLFGIRFLLSSLNGQQGEAIEKQREQYLKDLENTEEEIREISHGLRDNNEVLKTSFYQIIQNFLEERKSIYSFNISLSIKTGTFDLNEIPISYKINIFRILQEAIFNVEKYAKATGAKVSINVDKDEEYITLQVEDNGVGFDVNSVKKGIGLSNMQERTEEMGGRFKMTSRPSQTIVKVIIPIHYES